MISRLTIPIHARASLVAALGLAVAGCPSDAETRRDAGLLVDLAASDGLRFTDATRPVADLAVDLRAGDGPVADGPGTDGPTTDLGDGSDGGDAADGDAIVPDACPPTTCLAEAKQCGLIPDGCGGALDCGLCQLPAECGGGGAANVCGQGDCFIDLLAPSPGAYLPWAADWSFAVEPVWGATSYLWGFFQGGQAVFEKNTALPQLMIPANSPEHATLQPGPVALWIRANYAGAWTCARVEILTLQ